MIEPTVLRFEATDITAHAFDGMAILTMQTEKDGRVAVHMRRSVLVDLAVEIQSALNEGQLPADKV